jgi:hypothetical protein
MIEQPVTGAPDLVHLRQEVLTFLSGVEENIVTDAVLVTIMLAGDAFRYGEPPVTLRLWHLADRRALRVEVDYHLAGDAQSVPDGYRASILDRIASSRGTAQADGTTTSWAEISLRSARPMTRGA